MCSVLFWSTSTVAVSSSDVAPVPLAVAVLTMSNPGRASGRVSREGAVGGGGIHRSLIGSLLDVQRLVLVHLYRRRVVVRRGAGPAGGRRVDDVQSRKSVGSGEQGGCGGRRWNPPKSDRLPSRCAASCSGPPLPSPCRRPTWRRSRWRSPC